MPRLTPRRRPALHRNRPQTRPPTPQLRHTELERGHRRSPAHRHTPTTADSRTDAGRGLTDGLRAGKTEIKVVTCRPSPETPVDRFPRAAAPVPRITVLRTGPARREHRGTGAAAGEVGRTTARTLRRHHPHRPTTGTACTAAARGAAKTDRTIGQNGHFAGEGGALHAIWAWGCWPRAARCCIMGTSSLLGVGTTKPRFGGAALGRANCSERYRRGSRVEPGAGTVGKPDQQYGPRAGWCRQTPTG